jgi:replicative DNA helicase
MAGPVDIIKKTQIRKSVSDSNLLDYGKLPPQVKELEEAVLGAIMLEESAIHDVIEIIKTPEAFYLDAHQRIWRAMTALYHSHTNIDLLTVTEQLRKNGELEAAGGPFYVAQLTNKIGSSANIEDHSRIVIERYTARQMIAISSEVIKDAYEDTTDVFELVNKASAEIEAVNLELSGQGQMMFQDIVLSEVEKIRAAATSGNYITGVPTYSDVLDKHLLGFQEENLIIVAGRPGMGKTSVAWHIAINQAKHNIPVGFFSLEMSDRELIHKMISAEILVDTKTVRKGGMKHEEWQRLDSSLTRMSSYPIYMNDRAGISINQLMAVGRNWIRKYGVKVIYIDYIGKISTSDTKEKFGTREQQVSYISGQLKNFAKQMKTPVVLLSQLSREVEKRGGDKRPILSDLRESGAVEQDADVVVFCYRPEYYGINTDSVTGNILPAGYTELDIAKYRHGEPGTARWIFEPQYSRFSDFNPEPF